MRTFKVMPGRSDVIRSHAERAVLELFNTRMAAVSLSGYIFFGSSVSISDRVRPSAYSYPWTARAKNLGIIDDIMLALQCSCQALCTRPELMLCQWAWP